MTTCRPLPYAVERFSSLFWRLSDTREEHGRLPSRSPASTLWLLNGCTRSSRAARRCCCASIRSGRLPAAVCSDCSWDGMLRYQRCCARLVQRRAAAPLRNPTPPPPRRCLDRYFLGIDVSLASSGVAGEQTHSPTRKQHSPSHPSAPALPPLPTTYRPLPTACRPKPTAYCLHPSPITYLHRHRHSHRHRHHHHYHY